MKKINALIAGALTVGLLFSGASSASAEDIGSKVTNPDNRVQKADYTYVNATGQSVPSDGSKITWSRHNGDSPLDTNDRALKAHIGAPTADGNDYAEFYTTRSLEIDKRVGDVNNLSYDERTDTTGAGAPRISVVMVSGDVVYLTSSTCSTPIGVGPTWSRADFTGATADCMFYDNHNEQYAADGTHSAWDALVAAHPNWRVSYTFLVFDEAGTYVVDRVSLGTNRLYNYADGYAVRCHGDEDVC